jgi:hypothetical protein
MDMQDGTSMVLEEAGCPTGGNGCETGGELAAGAPDAAADRAGQAECTLIFWAIARGLKPAAGWFKAAGLSERHVAALARQHSGQLARLRQLSAGGELLDENELLVLLRARLGEALLEADSLRELNEAARILEKLPAASSLDEAEDDELSLEEAIAEARRLLAELDSDPYDSHPALSRPVVAGDGAAQ